MIWTQGKVIIRDKFFKGYYQAVFFYLGASTVISYLFIFTYTFFLHHVSYFCWNAQYILKIGETTNQTTQKLENFVRISLMINYNHIPQFCPSALKFSSPEQWRQAGGPQTHLPKWQTRGNRTAWTPWAEQEKNKKSPPVLHPCHAGASNKSRKLVIMSNCRVAVGRH